MSLSILNNIPALQAQNQLTQTNSALKTTLFRLASGSKLNSGADDAAGLSIANGLTANVAALTQSEANASNGVGELQTADGALSQVTSLLNRAVTLATEASTSTINATQAQSLQTEFQSIKDEIDNIGQKTNFNNQNVFGASTENQWSSTLLATPAVGTAATITITDAKTGKQGTFNLNGTDGGSALAATAATGGSLAAAINASGLSVKATFVSATNKLTIQDISGTNALTTTISSSGANIGALAQSTIPTNSTVANPNNWESTAGTVASPLTAASTLTTGTALTITDGDTQKSVTFTTTAGQKVGDLINAINAYSGTNSQSLNVTASLDATTGNLSIKDNNGNGSVFVAMGTANELGGISDTTSVPTGTTASVYLGDGTATTSQNTITTTINSLSAVTGLGLTNDLTTTAGAQTALTQITNAIATVAQQRGVIGASINRLTAATNVINNQIQNLTSAESNISSADISVEVSNMTKYNVLTQTGISALSQSNQMSQALLKLLQ